MAEKINHWCIICGKGYHACDDCAKIKAFKPWRTLADTPEHFQIYSVLQDYNNKLISRTEAREMLSNIDLSEKRSFKEGVKKVIDEILSKDSSTPKRAKKSLDDMNVTTDENDSSAADNDTDEKAFE